MATLLAGFVATKMKYWHAANPNRKPARQNPRRKDARMNRLQKLIVIATLLLLAWLLHTFFCDWDYGLTFSGNSIFTRSR